MHCCSSLLLLYQWQAELRTSTCIQTPLSAFVRIWANHPPPRCGRPLWTIPKRYSDYCHYGNEARVGLCACRSFNCNCGCRYNYCERLCWYHRWCWLQTNCNIGSIKSSPIFDKEHWAPSWSPYFGSECAADGCGLTAITSFVTTTTATWATTLSSVPILSAVTEWGDGCTV